MRRLITAILTLGALPAGAQTATEALAVQWNTICATASDGQLLVRCTETATSSDPDADLVAAAGQRLEEIPGQARIATRSDGSAASGSLQVRTGMNLAEFAADPGAASLGLRLSEQGSADANDLVPRWSLFATIETGRLDRKQGPNEAAFEAGSEHLTIGADWRVGTRSTAGAMFVLDREDLDYNDSLGRAKRAIAA